VARGRFGDGARLAVTTFTIVPVRAGRIDRDVARVAIGLAPLLGLGLGALAGGVALGSARWHAPALLAGLIAVGLLAALTRGLHLDGLADTVDALGSYRPRDRALAIMKSPEVGPFGVVALVFAVAVPSVCVAALTGRPWWATVAGCAAAAGAGRLAVTLTCRPGVPAANPTGLGAMVAGVAGTVEMTVGAVLVLAVSTAAVPGRPWQGPIAVLVALAAATGLVAHVRRRLGGITGDVLGACVEIATAVALVALVVGG